MVHALEAGVSASLDQPDAPPIQLGGTIATSTAGRPPSDIRPEHLALFAAGRTTHQEIADIYQCNPRTIRRRLIDYGLSNPGPPVYVNEPQEDGTTRRVYSAGRSSDLSQMTDEQLDTVMVTIYERFPSFGRRMVDGYLMALGERVPRRRIIESFQRVIGPPVATFGNRRIERRVYSVPGPNSLWHHDGQHGKSSNFFRKLLLILVIQGLIRWKIVIHAFIDGYSRLVLGIWASTNNRASTVLTLFEDITASFGVPSRVRGDHGTENLLVAAMMEQIRGVDCGSYIWGK